MAKNKSKSSKQVGAAQAKKVASSVPLKRVSKIEAVIQLLRRKEGATIAQLAGATDWQPHTVRSVLSRTLRVKGFRVGAVKAEGSAICTYRIVDTKAARQQ